MVSKILLASGLVASVGALDWALLVAGSKTFDNYRHQADLCHMYQILVANGLDKNRIVTMAYDDIAHNPDNKFPGQIFNAPDKKGLGVNVYDGCNLDYTGSDVTVQNFLGLLSGQGTTGGTGRMLDSTADDDVFVFYVDHGAKGLIQFPGTDVLHASDFQVALAGMHEHQRYGHLVIFMESCESGSMLENLPTDLNIYGVTAVGAENPSLGTYCGYDAYINNTYVGACLGDLFAVQFMDFLEGGDGSRTLSAMFKTVEGNVASYAALHWGHEINHEYGDLSMGDLTLTQFFYGANSVVRSTRYTQAPSAQVYSAHRITMDGLNFQYGEASNTAPSQSHMGVSQFARIEAASKTMRRMLHQEGMVISVYWNLAYDALGDSAKVEELMGLHRKPTNPECEVSVHNALTTYCSPQIKMTTSYALQFHRITVNLCNTALVSWSRDPQAGVRGAMAACQASKAKATIEAKKEAQEMQV